MAARVAQSQRKGAACRSCGAVAVGGGHPHHSIALLVRDLIFYDFFVTHFLIFVFLWKLYKIYT